MTAAMLERGGGARKAGLPGEAARARPDEGTGAGRWLVCSACGHRVTGESARTEIGGSHEHTFVNPHGYHYRIGCFSRAPGCVGEGPSSAFFSWFPGLPWRVASCANCRAHLGWSFAVPPAFHGLILDRIREE